MSCTARVYVADSDDSDNEGGLGNVEKVVMRPPGHSGKAKKGHLCFDAIYETGEMVRSSHPGIDNDRKIQAILVVWTLSTITSTTCSYGPTRVTPDTGWCACSSSVSGCADSIAPVLSLSKTAPLYYQVMVMFDSISL